MARISITLKKSTIGYARDQRRTIESLGLKRLNDMVEHEDTDSIRGMVRKVRHLVQVNETSSSD